MSKFEMSIVTRDGWVISLLTDQKVTLGDARIESIIVQPKEDYARRTAKGIDAERIVYWTNESGVRVTQSGREYDLNLSDGGKS